MSLRMGFAAGLGRSLKQGSDLQAELLQDLQNGDEDAAANVIAQVLFNGNVAVP